MATTQRSTVSLYECPDCGGDLVFDRAWTCADCTHVPRQSAD